MTQEYDRTLMMLSTALDMEEKGKGFYERVVKTTEDKLGRDIFAGLKEDEEKHIERIKKIYGSIKGEKVFTEEWRDLKVGDKDLKSIFSELVAKYGRNAKATTTDIEAVDIGLDLELKSVKFYEDQLSKAKDEEEKEFIRQMILEEKGHHALLSDLRLYLADPASWFSEHEHTGLDGA